MNTQDLEKQVRNLRGQMRSKMNEISDGTPEKEAAKIEREFDKLRMDYDEAIDRLDAARCEQVDTRKRPGGGDASTSGHEDSEHRKAFTSWLRSPNDTIRKQELSTVEKRTASGLTGAAGGYVIPEELKTPIMSRARDMNPFRQICRVIDVSTTDVKIPLSEADATQGWVGETGTRTATTDPTLALRSPTFGTAYANVSVSEEMLEDAAIDVGDWFSYECGRAMGEAEMTSVISGNGTDKPTGLLNTAPESAADGSRTDLALRYIASGAAADLGTTPADLLIDTTYDLKAEYLAGASWVMNSTIAATVRKLKNGSGDYLWADGLKEGQPNRLMGYPVYFAEDMDDEGTNTFPIMFGNFNRGYILCQHRVGLIVLPDPYTTKGLVNFYIRNRIGGITHDENAIRVIKCATS